MWIILVDLRENNGQVMPIVDEHDNVAQFAELEKAKQMAKLHPLPGHFPSWAFDLDTGKTVLLRSLAGRGEQQ